MAPHADDAERTQAILEGANLSAFICPDVDALAAEMERGVGTLITTDDALTPPMLDRVRHLLEDQGIWSDLPIVVLTRPLQDDISKAEELLALGNVTLIERPVRVATLVSSVRSSLRARERQYEQRDRLQAQALLAAIVESSDDAIVSKKLDGTILSWNSGAERLFGYTADEAVGQSIRLIIPEDRIDEEMMILDRLRRGERIEHYETVRRAKSGKLLDISLTVSPIRDSTNRVIAASKVARDISQRREVEKALRDADRRKDEFLATLAHELRNPLAPIRNSLHILRVTGPSEPALDRVRDILDRQVNHMVRLVDDLLEVSRITRGKIELRKEHIELAAVIGSAVETSKPLIETGGHELAISIPPQGVILDADPVRLAQVFSNLLNNAAKYSEPGGKIWLTAETTGNKVVVRVRDAGIGIAPEMLPRVFEMFAQIESSLDRAQGGLGIGLTLVRSLLHLHDGTVEARSEGLGKGSEFIVTLPVIPLERSFRTTPRSGEYAVPLAAQRVLIVDDNRDAADSLGMMLKMMGAVVHVEYDSYAALAALGKFKPNVALIDLSMDGMDGYEFARRIRGIADYKRMALIALSGWGQDDDRRRSRDAGFDFHLIKPPDVDALQALMASLSGGRAAGAPA
ncbi:MAG TPA: ATP-binding protein [Gemmatimonadaceae bacterium]|nr:ATP-binding protein [Gemmatimonadaceae bacterium]